MDKFEQIRMELDFSFAFQLCVDSMLTNLVCPQIEGLSAGICNSKFLFYTEYLIGIVTHSNRLLRSMH